MKKFFVLTVLVLAASVSQAKVICGISTETKAGSAQFDHPIHMAELTSNQMVLLSKNGQSTESIELEKYPETFAKSNGQYVAYFTQSAPGTKISLTLAKIDVSAPHLVRIVAATAGEAKANAPVFLMTERYALTCSEY
jgi:hypothetical protein